MKNPQVSGKNKFFASFKVMEFLMENVYSARWGAKFRSLSANQTGCKIVSKYRLFNMVGEKSQICNSRKGEKIIVDSHRWNYFRELCVGEWATKEKKIATLEEAEMAKGLEEINHFILADEIVEALILRFFTAQVDDPWTHGSIPTVNEENSPPENCLKTGSLLKDYRRKKNVRLHVTLNQILSFPFLCSFSVEPSPLTN